MRRSIILALIALLLTACTDKWQRVENGFRVGAPRVIQRFEDSGKLSHEEAQALNDSISPLIADIKSKDFASAALHLGNIAKVKIKNPEARRWLDDLLAVTQIILGVNIPADGPQMKAMPKEREPDLSDANIRRLELLVK